MLHPIFLDDMPFPKTTETSPKNETGVYNINILNGFTLYKVVINQNKDTDSDNQYTVVPDMSRALQSSFLYR